MELIDIISLYNAGQYTTTVETGDVFLLGRPNSQRGDKYSVLAINKTDLTTYFVSQVPVPTPFTLSYKIYTALLTQSGTSAPSVVVLENTLGFTPTWQYDSVGYYYIQNPLFVQDDMALFIQKDSLLTNAALINKKESSIFYDGSDAGGGYVSVQTVNNTALANGVLSKTTIEIKVYT